MHTLDIFQVQMRSCACPPVCGCIVAVVWQEVIVEFPEDVQCDAAIWGRDIVVGFTEHGIKVVDREVLGQEFVAQAVTLYQAIQLLWRTRNAKSG